MYDQSSVLISGTILVSMLLAIEVGYRIGWHTKTFASEASRKHIGAIQASLLGVLALLLGFTFSLALQRFDSRSEAVANEANAIGTTYLRAQLLPASIRGKVLALLQRYVDLRVQAGAISLDNEAQRRGIITETNRILDELWYHARRIAEEDEHSVTYGLFIQSLNELIDSYGKRDAELNRHIPEVILFLLYGTFIMSAGVIGHAAGIAGHRASFATYILVALIVIVSFIVIDLDRPRRGLIRVDQESLIHLQSSIDKAQTAVTGHH